MLIGYNEATSMKYSTLEKDLILCEKFGYDFIEPRVGMLNEYLKSKSINELNDFFNRSKIRPFALNALEFFNLKTPEEFKEV